MSRASTTTYVLVAAIISLFVHFAFIVGVSQVKVSGLGGVTAAGQKEDRPIKVQTVDIHKRLYQAGRGPGKEAMSEMQAKIAQKKLRDIFQEENLIPSPAPKLRLKRMGENVEAPQQADKAETSKPAAPRPSILGIEADRLSVAEDQPTGRPTFGTKDRQVVKRHVPSLIDTGDFSAGGEVTASMRLGLPGVSKLEAGKGPGQLSLLQMPDKKKIAGEAGNGDTDSGENSLTPLDGAPQLGKTEAGQPDNKQNVEKMDQLLNVSLVVDPDGEDGGGTFRMDIKPNPRSDLLKSISKDVLFLVDSSTSISPSKFKRFKRSTRAALQYLNPKDRFNVVYFKVKPHKLFDTFAPVSSQNLARARKYLRHISRGGLTDVYGGLAPCIQEAAAENGQRPVNVFLMTDGESTVKDKMKNEKLIREVAQLNKEAISVYTFSAGKDVNRFLLDFLAYNNRGQSLHAQKLKKFRDTLVRFITRHSELIVDNLKYQVRGHVSGTIYPKRLPHLYRQETLHIYGKYPPGAEEIVVQITGRNATGKLEELVYKGNVRNASTTKHNLAADWAAQKIFHLIAERTLAADRKVYGQKIRRLSRKYNLYIPYK